MAKEIINPFFINLKNQIKMKNKKNKFQVISQEALNNIKGGTQIGNSTFTVEIEGITTGSF
jgi:hypothetical protein